MDHPPQYAPMHHPLGPRRSWLRHWALLGALSSAIAILSLGLPVFRSQRPELLMLALVGTTSGAAGGLAVGSLLRNWFTGVLARIPLPLVFCTIAGVGFAWGVFIGAMLILVVDGRPFRAPPGLVLTFTGLCGAVQVGLFWFPYTWLRTRQRPGGIVLALSGLAAVFLPLFALPFFTFMH